MGQEADGGKDLWEERNRGYKDTEPGGRLWWGMNVVQGDSGWGTSG